MPAVLGALVALALLLVPPGARAAPAAGEPLHDFTLATLDGTRVQLSRALGAQATVVVFWAAWSPRSAAALADYQKLFASYGPNRLQVIAVNVEHQQWDPAEAGRIQEVTDAAGVTYPLVLDTDLSVFAGLGFSSVPSSLLLDGGGAVAAVLQGYPAVQRQTFATQIRRALGVAEPPRPAAETSRAYRPKDQAATALRMGQLYLSQGKRTRGLNLLSKAVAEDPFYREAYRALAAALVAAGRLDEAERVRAALASMPDAPCAGEANAVVAQAPCR